jgi:hypothetical protein
VLSINEPLADNLVVHLVDTPGSVALDKGLRPLPVVDVRGVLRPREQGIDRPPFQNAATITSREPGSENGLSDRSHDGL